MKKRIIFTVILAVVLVLEILPIGAVCNFASPEGEAVRTTFSYFDLTPFGYANYAPFFTALLSCLLFFVSAVWCITGAANTATALRNILIFTAVISLLPLVHGIAYYSVPGLAITLILIGETVWLQLAINRAKRLIREKQAESTKSE